MARTILGMLILGLVASMGCASDGAGEAMTELPEIDPAEGFRVDVGRFEVNSGDEIIYCVRIPIPERFQGRDIALLGWDWDLPPHTHHFFMAYSREPFPSPGEEPVPCDGVDPIVPVTGGATGIFGEVDRLGEGKILFGAGVGIGTNRHTSDSFGTVMAEGGHLVTNFHVLNASAARAEMYGLFNLYVRDAADVPFPISALNCLTMDVEVEPRGSRAVTATCTVPFDLQLVTLSSHAHNHLVKFETRIYDGEQTLSGVIYESRDWDSPAIEAQAEPILLRQGQGLTFTCHYDNDQDVWIQFGFGVENEMCATMNGYTYPPDRPHEIPPNLGAIIVINYAGPVELLNTDELNIGFF
jgi:hypothetical protein